MAVGATIVAAAAWLAFERWWDPRVDVPAPRRIARQTGAQATVVFLGDTAPADAALATLRARGYDYAFDATRAIVGAADLAVANLEAPIAPAGTPFGPWKKYRYRIEPEALPALRAAGIDLFGLANNHAMDCGAAGLRATLAALGGDAFGAGASAGDARRGVVARLGAAHVGLLAYREANFADAVWSRAFARTGRPGVARLSARAAREDIARLRRAGAALVVAFVHWGENYEGVTMSQRRLARALADAGFDLVVGHHPHVAQPLARVGRTLVAYSIGNYAFGTRGRAPLRTGLILRAALAGAHLARVELLPIEVQNRRVKFQPRPLAGEAARRALAPLVAASRDDGVDLRVVDDRGVAEWR